MSPKRKSPRGFAALPPARLQEIAASGGIAAHQQGRCHRWNAEEARVAGRKGGFARRKHRMKEEGEDG